MPFNLVQAGSNLYSLDAAGGVSSALTLPTNITLSNVRRPRFTRFGKYVVVVNTPSRPLSVDDTGTVRPLTPLASTNVPVLSGETGGALSGTFLAKQTFVFLDTLGNVIAESDYGPLPANAKTITSQYLRVDNIALSPDASAISGTRLYRTTAGPGGVYFPWATIPGNTQVSFRDDLSDAGIGLIAGPSLGSAPDLTQCVEWNGRLWGVDRVYIDNLRYTEAGTMYGWNALNTLPIPHVGDDQFGITSLIPRRNVLGVARQNRLVQVAGSSRAEIRPVGVIENCGSISPEAVIVYRDAAFFLWKDGVYMWTNDGLVCISDAAMVRTWFTSNSYFNPAMFSQAFATFDPIRKAYRLFLASAGSYQIDRWVEYNLTTNKFYGPHKTAAFTPSCAFGVRGSDDRIYPMVGSREGYVSFDTDVRSDWGLAAIDMRVTMNGHRQDDPDTEKYFGELSVMTDKETAGTLTITAKVGDMGDEVTSAVMSHDLTKTRERLDRVGHGKNAVIIFQNAVVNQNVTIRGYEIDPVSTTGRR